MSAQQDELPSPHHDRGDVPGGAGSGPDGSPAPPTTDVAAFPLSKITLASCAATTILIILFIIAAVCFRLLEGIEHPITEALILLIVVQWASIPCAQSDIDLLRKALNTSLILFPFLYFIAYQSTTSFWLTYFVLVAVAFDEHRRRLDDEPLHTKVAQILTILFVTAQLLLWFTAHFLPTLQAMLVAQFDNLYKILKLREILGIILGSIILYATALRTLHRFRSFEWREFAIRRNLPEVIAEAVHVLVYYIGNFFRIIGIAFVTVLREAIIYALTTFFSIHLWRTIFYIVTTAAVSALLVVDDLFLQPYLIEVLRNSQPFFAPTASLIVAYLAVIVAFAVAAGGIAALIRIRLTRDFSPLLRHLTYKAFTLTSSGLFICIWIAAFTAWVVNFIFQLDAKQFVTPGYFTCVAIIFAIRAAISAIRSGELRAPPDQHAT